MSFLDKLHENRVPEGEELFVELGKFVKIAQNVGAMGDEEIRETVHTGLWLLRHLPVARDGIFDIITVIYDDYVKTHMAKLEEIQLEQLSAGGNLPTNVPDEDSASPSSTSETLLLKDIHTAFITYLESCGEIWAPILSTWALQLLGQLSTAYADRALFTRVQSVNEVIKIWMGSKAVQSLVTITSRCLDCKGHANTDAFIVALLDTSGSHSPHFDWVVAHVGNTYPQTVVTEVLAQGLRNFSSNPPQASTLSSIVGILGHLATTHSKEVQHAFDQMLMRVLSSNNQVAETYAIPYLLQLCSSSVPLLDVLMDSALPKVKEETLQVLGRLIPGWIQLHFGGNGRALFALVTHLIMKSTRGPNALRILMQGSKTWRGPIGHNSRYLLDHFIMELSRLLYESDVYKDLVKNFPCITALKENAELMITFLTDSDLQISRVIKQLIKLIALYESETVGVKAIIHYLQHAEHDRLLWNLKNLVGALELKYPSILRSALQMIVVKSDGTLGGTSSYENKIRPWRNILRIVKSENMRKFPHMRRKLSQVIRENLSILTPFLDIRRLSFSIEETGVIVEILAKIPNLTDNVSFGTLLTLERYLVELLFKILSLGESQRNAKIRNLCHISKLLVELCATQPIQNDALRSLVQSCLNPECRGIFRSTLITPGSSRGGDPMFDNDEYEPERFSTYTSLWDENQKRPSSVSLSRVHSTRFEAVKSQKHFTRSWILPSKIRKIENPEASLSVQLFLSIILSVCSSNTSGEQLHPKRNLKDKKIPKAQAQDGLEPEVSIEAMRKVALLLVEIVSPDVMFNGLPWPEEEFSKVQVERDLQIRRAFEENPYLWDLLELVANYSPSLCYCSVLLRALMATFMAHWTSIQDAPASRSPVQLELTTRLLNVMKIGQLIPPPLSFIGDVIGPLKGSEVLMLLRDIWWYMKVNVPVPTVFIKDPNSKKFIRNADFGNVDPAFTEKLRLIILDNVATLGHLYPKLFPEPPFPTD